jgi:hypothetical protein
MDEASDRNTKSVTAPTANSSAVHAEIAADFERMEKSWV